MILNQRVLKNIFFYAVDAAISGFHQDKGVLEKTLTLQLQEASTWFLDNKLSLHIGKTEAILFASTMKLNKDDPFS